MLEIELSDGSGKLDVLQDEKVSFQNIYNMLTFDKVNGEKSWNFKLRKTANNKRKLKWISVPESRTNIESIEVNLILNANLWRTGLLYFLDDGDTYIEVHYAGGVGFLKTLFGETHLNEIPYPIVSGITNIYDHASTVVQSNYLSHDYVFTQVSLPNRRESSNSMFTAINGYEVDVNTNWLGFKETINGFPNHANAMVPFPYVINVLFHIANYFGLKLSGDFFTDSELRRLVFFNTITLNEIDSDGLPTENYPTEINIQNHLPKITIRAFFTEIAKLFNQRLSFSKNESTLYFKSRNDLLNEPPVIDYRYKVKSARLKHGERRTYNLGYDYIKEDVTIYQDQGIDPKILEGVNSGSNSKDIDCAISTIPTWFKITPISSLKLNDEIPLQLLFFRGFVQNPGINLDRQIPASTSDLTYEPYLSGPKDNYSLLWQGEGGLYPTWWETFLSTISLGRVLRISLLMNALDIHRFHPERLYALKDYICLFETLEFTSKEGKLLTEATVLKL